MLLKAEDIMVGTSSQEISFELELKTEQAFAKSKRNCEAGEGNSRLTEMKQTETNERQNDKRQRSRDGYDSLQMSVKSFGHLEGLWILSQS